MTWLLRYMHAMCIHTSPYSLAANISVGLDIKVTGYLRELSSIGYFRYIYLNLFLRWVLFLAKNKILTTDLCQVKGSKNEFRYQIEGKVEAFLIAGRVTRLWSCEFGNACKRTMFEHSTPCFGGVSRRIRKSFHIALELVKEHL